MPEAGRIVKAATLHAIILHCGTKSVRIAHRITLMESFTQYLPKNPFLSPFIDSDTQIHTTQQCISDLYSILIHWWIVYAILLQPALLHR